MNMTSLAGLDDYKSWSKLIEHCDTIDGLTEIEREQAKRALSHLRSELGEDFLATILENRHPFSQQVFNLAPWTRKWVREFADELRLAKSSPGYSSLLTDETTAPHGGC